MGLWWVSEQRKKELEDEDEGQGERTALWRVRG